MAVFLCEELAKADTILFGRVTYNAMAAYWSSKGINLTAPPEDRAFADMVNRYKKVVFSCTLHHAVWNNTEVVKQEPAEYIMRLVESAGCPVMVYGSGKLVRYLIEKNLVDEFHLWVHPVTLGEGKPLFHDKAKHHLQLERSKLFKNGVVTLCYSVEKETKGRLIS